MLEKEPVIVHNHMSDTELRAIINERKHLSPERAVSLLKDLEIKLAEVPKDREFKGYHEVYHTKEAIFYYIGYGRPEPYLEYVFLNERFIVYVYIGSNYIGLDLKDNLNIPTKSEKRETVDQLIYILKKIDFFWVDLTDENNLKIEFIGE